jgi:hypothetical protein
VDEPLYRYPTLAYASQVFAVVGAGVARAALDYAEEVGAGYSGVSGDALVPKQHAFLSPAILDAAGAVLMGLPPTSPGFR